MVKETIYVDESGNSGLRNNNAQRFPFFVMGFCFFCDSSKFKIEMKRLLRKLHKKKQYHHSLRELKFNPYSALQKLGCSQTDIQTAWEPHFDAVRKKVNALIEQYTNGIFAGILDKRTIRGTFWTSEKIGNYLFSQSLFKNILPLVGFSSTPEVIYDRGRLDPKRTLTFNSYLLNTDSYLTNMGLKRYSGNVVRFRDEDSEKNSGIWGADFIAGSFRHAHFHNDPTYLNILRPKLLGSGSMNLWF